MLHLFLRQAFERICRVHDDAEAIVGDDGRFHVHAFAGGRRDFRWFRAPAGHADLSGAIGDRRDAGCGTFGRDVEGGAGVLRFELFRQLRDELCAQSIGAFDD